MDKRNSKLRTIYDIARLTGVSPTTVSFVLNKKGNISAKTRHRILDVTNKLNYIPNKIARQLRKKKTYNLGIVIDHFNNRFFNSVFEGIESVVEKKGYSFLVSETKEDYENEKKAIKLFMEFRVDGLILFPCSKDYSYLQTIYKQYEIPVVLIGNYYEDYSFPYIVADNWTGGRLATEKLISLNRFPIIHIAGPQQQSMCYLRQKAFIQTMEENLDIDNIEDYIFQVNDLNFHEGYIAMDKINNKYKPPFSIFAVNDTTALGVIKYCNEKNIRIPEDVTLIGFSDIDLLDKLGIKLTSVRISGNQMGKEAAKTIITCAENIKSDYHNIKKELPVTLIERQSTSI